MVITIKYAIFAVFATASNLISQKISLTIYTGLFSLYIAMAFGTLTGLIVKYILDKKFIFYYSAGSSKNDIFKFILYSITGVATTIIFWGFEIAFHYIYHYPGSKYTGALIGLCIGYICKYQLDKKYVFKKTLNVKRDLVMDNSKQNMRLTAWGNYPVINANVTVLKSLKQLQNTMKSNNKIIPYGNGRSYGDQALGNNVVITKDYNYITGFNEKKGILTCQCGVTLEEILEVIVPKGWFLPVTPGTKFITIGGAIASDVHGKNHHKEGSFCNYILSFDLMLPDGKIITCSKKQNKEIFQATCGGNGLTGIILHATFSLKPVETAYIKERTIKAANIDELITLIEENESYTYAVAWIDCVSTGKKLGRGVLLLGEHAVKSDLKKKDQKNNPLILKNKRKLNVPLYFPNFALNKLSIKIFNMLYYFKAKNGISDSIIDYNSFFYPLDAIDNWNKIYGKRGFTQYQFVVPKTVGTKGVREIVQQISKNGMGSFLAVLKTSGPSNGNYLSFPMEGYTLALDFAIKKKLFPFFDRLDKIVEEFGGRLYTTKDVRMSSDFFKNSYPDLKKFTAIRKKIKADKKFSSMQSNRLEIK